MQRKTYSGNIVDIINRRIFPGTITVEDGKITEIRHDESRYDDYLMPGFIDAHVHIESSMMTPAEFARIASVHGTVGTVSDPHEIANVLGAKGIEFMIENGRQVLFHFAFSAPSCVPATDFETSGGGLNAEDVNALLKRDEIKYLGEMMNYPGVLHDVSEVMKKIAYAKAVGKLIDGHAPGLRGNDLKKYIEAGISTDHECIGIDEAREKISSGMKIIIREGSAARNFNELIPLMKEYPDMLMFCSDDKHPDDLLNGHINELVKRAVNSGYDLFDVLRAASYNPIKHYGLSAGLLRTGDSADFIITDNLKDFNIKLTVINGIETAQEGKTLIEKKEAETVNQFNIQQFNSGNMHVKPECENHIIGVLDGELITEHLEKCNEDICKIIIVNRYKNAEPACAYVHGFGLKKGAIASSVAHDSHNIIAMGTNDKDIIDAVNLIIEHKGGISACSSDMHINEVMPLPIAGLMSDLDYTTIAEQYSNLNSIAKKMGSNLRAPYMTLSFLALPVIPKLKLTDKGLVDVERFKFIE